MLLIRRCIHILPKCVEFGDVHCFPNVVKLFQIEVNETSKREIGALLVLFTFSGFTGSCINLCKQKID